MKIQAIQTGTVQIRPRQVEGQGDGFQRQLNILTDKAWTEPLPIYAWVIEHPEGVIVVDTGDTARTSEPGYFPAWHPYYRLAVRFNIAPEQEVGPQLQKLGITPGDVRQVILTHMHTDHAGGLHHFPNSQILVNPAELKLARSLAGRVLSGYLPHRWPGWFNPQPIAFQPMAVGPFDGSYQVTKVGDVVVVPTPGHTVGHVSVIVEADGVSYFLAGDTTYSDQLLIQQKVDGVSPDVGQALQSIKTILSYAQSTPTVYLPTHDVNSVRRLTTKTTLIGS